MIPPCPPGWRPSRRGGLRRQLGSVELFVSRRRGRGDYYIGVTLRCAVHDSYEAAAVAEAVARRLSSEEAT